MAVTAAFLLVAFFTGIAGAFQIPVLSLYLAKEVKAAPAAIGFFYMVNAALRKSTLVYQARLVTGYKGFFL